MASLGEVMLTSKRITYDGLMNEIEKIQHDRLFALLKQFTIVKFDQRSMAIDEKGMPISVRLELEFVRDDQIPKQLR